MPSARRWWSPSSASDRPSPRPRSESADADDVDLALRPVRRRLGDPLQPVEADHLALALGQQEVAGVEPGLPQPHRQVVGRPGAVLGMIGEDVVVEREPGVACRAERRTSGSRRPAGRQVEGRSSSGRSSWSRLRLGAIPRLRAMASLAGRAPYAQSLSSLAPAFRASASTVVRSCRPMPRRRLVGQTTTSAVASVSASSNWAYPTSRSPSQARTARAESEPLWSLRYLCSPTGGTPSMGGDVLDQGVDRVAERDPTIWLTVSIRAAKSPPQSGRFRAVRTARDTTGFELAATTCKCRPWAQAAPDECPLTATTAETLAICPPPTTTSHPDSRAAQAARDCAAR